MKSAKRKKSYRTALCLLLILLFTLSTVGCSRLSFVSDTGKDETPPTGDGTGEDVPAITPPQPTPTVYYNRYTGLACDEALLSCRPISVLMGNFDGTQQKGLSFADILIEAPVDGDKTRLWAVLTNPRAASELSSVSTVRDYFMPLPRALGTVCAYAGTTDTVGGTATDYAGDNLDYTYHNLTSTFTREADGTLTTSGSAILSAAEGRGYALTDTGCVLPYRLAEVDEPYHPQSNPIREISFRFATANTVTFRYDATSGAYQREQCGAIHTDPITGATLSYQNVLLLFHNVKYYHTPSDTSFSLDTASGGEGYAYTGGGVVRVRWAYDESGALSITDETGAPVTLNRGKTYIGMLRVTDSATVVAK